MVLIEYHLGLRQVVMALMNWAIDVPQKLLQSDAKPFLFFFLFRKFFNFYKKLHFFLFYFIIKTKVGK
jgi:hypothetical protein